MLTQTAGPPDDAKPYKQLKNYIALL
jgi:hypothetical protein